MVDSKAFKTGVSALPEGEGAKRLDPAVPALLAALRRRIRRYVWIEGLGGGAAWLGAAFWISMALDWLFEPPGWVRLILLAFIGGALMAILFRLIGQRAFRRISDANLALVLERRFPVLGDSLSTAVSLGDRAKEIESHPELVARTYRQAAEGMAEVDPRRVLRPEPLWQKLSAAGLLALSIAMFSLLFPQALGIWARRALAMSDALWPRRTRLEIDGFRDGIRKIARGDDFEVLARADTDWPLVPQTVEVRYRTDGARGRAAMDRRGAVRRENKIFQEYAYSFRGVLSDIRFDVVGGDDRIADLWIQAVDSPVVSKITLDCRPPAYMGRDRIELAAAGVTPVPAGSRVTLRAEAANKPLVRAEAVRLVGESVQPIKTLEAADLSIDRRGFSLDLGTIDKDLSLRLTLTDADGIRGRDPPRLAIVAVADRPPQIVARLDGIGSAVTPKARLPVVGQMTDDYGVSRAWFEIQADQQSPIQTAIRVPDSRPTDFLLDGTALELGELGMKPGQKLSVRLKAADFCDLGRGPNQAAGDPSTLDVVAPEQLRTLLETRELALRQRFDRMIQEMTETRDLLVRLDWDSPQPSPLPKGEGTSFNNPLPKGEGVKQDEPPDDSPERRRTLRVLGVQGALTNCRKSAHEVTGLADAFDDIRKQLINNRIDNEELKNRLHRGIIQPLQNIAGSMFPELELRLDRLGKTLDDPAAGRPLGERARQTADEILAAMQAVRGRMLELEDFHEALDLLRGIIKMQEDLHHRTQDRHNRKIRDLLED